MPRVIRKLTEAEIKNAPNLKIKIINYMMKVDLDCWLERQVVKCGNTHINMEVVQILTLLVSTVRAPVLVMSAPLMREKREMRPKP